VPCFDPFEFSYPNCCAGGIMQFRNLSSLTRHSMSMYVPSRSDRSTLLTVLTADGEKGRRSKRKQESSPTPLSTLLRFDRYLTSRKSVVRAVDILRSSRSLLHHVTSCHQPQVDWGSFNPFTFVRFSFFASCFASFQFGI
jgi:hypothetical protein